MVSSDNAEEIIPRRMVSDRNVTRTDRSTIHRVCEKIRPDILVSVRNFITCSINLSTYVFGFHYKNTFL
jgi:hypothetical protein